MILTILFVALLYLKCRRRSLPTGNPRPRHEYAPPQDDVRRQVTFTPLFKAPQRMLDPI